MAEADMFEKLKWAASTGLDLSPGDPLAAWAVAEIERLRTALEQCNEYRDDPHKIIGIVDAALAGMPPYDFKRNAHETTSVKASSSAGTQSVTLCGPEDHLYAAVAGSPFGDGVCIKCGAQEPTESE